MIEQALYFAIGFLAAALAATAASPLLSRRAMRLAVQHARLKAPMTEKQAIADMDALRAHHAVEQTRIEHRLSLAESASMTWRAAAGRQAAELIRLRSELADLEGVLYDERARAETFTSQARELHATVAAAEIGLNDAFAQRDRMAGERDDFEARVMALDGETNRGRARVAVLTARSEYLEGRLDDLTRAAETARTALQASAAKLEAERGRIATLEARLGATTGESRALAGRTERSEAERRALATRLGEIEERLRQSERTRAETLVENGRQLAAVADMKSELASTAAKAAALDARLSAAAAEAQARQSTASLRAETLAAALAAAEGSLKVAREEREALRRESEALRSRIAAAESSGAGDAELRESIARLGREVTRVFAVRPPLDNRESEGSESRPAGARAAGGALAPADAQPLGFAEGARRRAGRSLAPER